MYSHRKYIQLIVYVGIFVARNWENILAEKIAYMGFFFEFLKLEQKIVLYTDYSSKFINGFSQLFTGQQVHELTAPFQRKKQNNRPDTGYIINAIILATIVFMLFCFQS